MTEQEKQKEKEFLSNRIPFFLDDESRINIINKNDANQKHSDICDKYHYNWHLHIRGYLSPNEFVMLYIADYEIPNCTTWLIQYFFNKFPDIKWVGLGCIKGKIGEYWRPRMVVVRDNEENFKLLPTEYNDIFNKQSEESMGK